MTTLPDRFWSKVDKSGECWLWTARLNESGYGHYSVRLQGGRGRGGWTTRYAHRVSYEAHVGTIPHGMVIDHLCRNRSCVNPLHLEVVTPLENIRRGESPNVQIWRSGKCGNGHVRTTENTYIRPDGKGRLCLACAGERESKRRRGAA